MADVFEEEEWKSEIFFVFKCELIFIQKEEKRKWQEYPHVLSTWPELTWERNERLSHGRSACIFLIRGTIGVIFELKGLSVQFLTNHRDDPSNLLLLILLGWPILKDFNINGLNFLKQVSKRVGFGWPINPFTALLSSKLKNWKIE